jgi:hypothetical protein
MAGEYLVIPLSLRFHRRGFKWPGALAFMLYAAISFSFVAYALHGDFSGRYLGTTADPAFSMWLLAWWHYALGHHLNPFVTHVVWAPHGTNLAWSTCIPLAALLAYPLTHFFGIVATYNLLCALSLALAGWAAFLLCHYARGWFWPAFLGGCVFAFSPFMLTELRAHLCLLLVFPVPLGAYLVARRFAGEISARKFTGLFALTLAAQFWLFVEVFATATVFGALLFGLLLLWFQDEPKRRLVAILPPIFFAYLTAFILALPYLYAMLAFGHSPGLLNPLDLSSADLLNFLVPTPVNTVGTYRWLGAISPKFTTYESGAFVGPVLILVSASFLIRYPNRPVAKALVAFVALVCLASLGPIVRAWGRVVAPGPWLLVMLLPLIRNALPGRFMMFAFLALGVILSLWLTLATVSRFERVLAAVFVALLLWPNQYSGFWSTPLNTPLLFRPNMISHWLPEGQTALVLPFGPRGNSVLWQAETNNYFQMAGGPSGPVPPEYQRWPATGAFLDNTDMPDGEFQLKAFLAQHDVNVVIVEASEEGRWSNLLSTLGVTPKKIGGVFLYGLSPEELNPYKIVTTLELRDRFYTGQLRALLEAATRYIGAGFSLAELTPDRVAKLGLLPASWINEDFGPRTNSGLWLGGSGSEVEVGVGLFGSDQDSGRPIFEQVGKCAERICFPCANERTQLPASLERFLRGNQFLNQIVQRVASALRKGIGKRMLVFSFDQQGLNCALAAVSSLEKPLWKTSPMAGSWHPGVDRHTSHDYLAGHRSRRNSTLAENSSSS